MTARIAVLAAILCTTSLAAAEPVSKANAHPPLAQALKGDARVLYDAARELFKAGDYPSAYAKFQRALELSNDPRLNWNLAACERKVKHNANVLRLIETYLHDGEGWLLEDDKKEATRAAAAVRTFVASATVTSQPAEGVEIFVDDLHVSTTPVDKPIWIDVGVHRVRFTIPGKGKSVERTEEIHAGAELKWSVDLDRPAAPDPVAPATPGAAAPPRSAVDSARSEPAPSRSHTGALILGGTGVAALATGGVLVFLTTRHFSDLRSDCGTSCDPARWEGQRTTQIVGDTLLAVGGAALVLAAVWWIATPSARARAAASAHGIVF
jgi:hypothetical protein